MESFNPFEHKPDISESSRRLYVFNLTKLNGGKPIKDLKWLGRDSVMEHILTLKPNTRRTYLISIVSALRGRQESKYTKLYRKFYDLLMSLNKELKDNTAKTPKVEENWMEQEDVKSIQQKLSEVLSRIEHNKKVTEAEYTELLHLVVVSLYTLQQPRRNKDYTDMCIVRKTPEDMSKNYLDIFVWNWVFNNYKTQKTYKSQTIPINEDLQKILEIYLKFHPRAKEIKKKSIQEAVPFLVKYDGTPIATSPEMTRMLNKIFGKKIGCSMLRSIFLTDKYGDTVKKLREDTAQMGTSSETAQNNYIKQ